MLHISRNVWSLNIEHWAREFGEVHQKMVNNSLETACSKKNPISGVWLEGELAIIQDSGPRVRERILHFPESDWVLAFIPDRATFVPDLWPSPFSGVWLERVLGELFRTLVHVSERCLAWPRRVLSAFSIFWSLTDVLAIISDCAPFVPDLWPSPFFPESGWKEWWGIIPDSGPLVRDLWPDLAASSAPSQHWPRPGWAPGARSSCRTATGLLATREISRKHALRICCSWESDPETEREKMVHKNRKF